MRLSHGLSEWRDGQTLSKSPHSLSAGPGPGAGGRLGIRRASEPESVTASHTPRPHWHGACKPEPQPQPQPGRHSPSHTGPAREAFCRPRAHSVHGSGCGSDSIPEGLSPPGRARAGPARCFLVARASPQAGGPAAPAATQAANQALPGRLVRACKS